MNDISKRRLKLWLKLLTMTRTVEGQLRDYLRLNHTTTLPRFDVMAALYRHDSPISMSELSRFLLVSNGNATIVVDRLEADGLAVRTPSTLDRRTVLVTLTPAGRAQFEEMASGHEAEVMRIFTPFSETDIETLTHILKQAEQK